MCVLLDETAYFHTTAWHCGTGGGEVAAQAERDDDDVNICVAIKGS